MQEDGQGQEGYLKKVRDLEAQTAQAKRSKHKHAEAYHLMTYTADDGSGAQEVIWNSRDGVTPFTLTLQTGQVATHTNWADDVYAPAHKPKPEDRIFIDLTPARAQVQARAALARWADQGMDLTGAPSVEALAASFTSMGGEPDLIAFADWNEHGAAEGE